MENLKAIIEAMNKTKEAEVDAAKKARSIDEEIYAVIDKRRADRAGLFNTPDEIKKSLAELHEKQARINQTRNYYNLLLQALSAEAIREAEAMICNSLLSNKDKIEGVPARHKKVKNLLDIFGNCGVRAYYNEYYHYINIYMTNNYSAKAEANIYITSGYDEPVIDFETCKKNSDYQFRSPAEVEKQLKKFIAAQSKIEAEEKKAAAKIAAIKEGNYCLGVSFESKF